jgi:transcription factor STE12
MFARCATRPSRAPTILHSKLHTLLSNRFQCTNLVDRHRRTHEPRPDGEPLSDYQEDDLEGEEDHLHSLEEDSPESGNDYLSLSHHAGSLSDMPGPVLGMTSMAPPQQLMAGSHY